MNVYYLPTRLPTTETPELPLTATRWSILRARTHRAWWRFRLTMIEVMAVIRRGGPGSTLQDHIWFADAEDAPLPAPRRSLGPAQVLDFEAARRRRALAANA
jgi:hypothetical protein